ncbi:hypothetical protein [Micromonospora sp. NPDC049102]|uniref:hypothetical protein n=1 Tax=Micromonospora sp. NPDC049102 TaxID=3364265 RepID=UPI003712CACD
MAAPTAEQVPTWLTAAIAALAVILGAAATAIATIIAANKKVREVEITYLQRLQESYLENARAYTNSIYVPIAIAMTRLLSAFDQFRLNRDADSEDSASLLRFKDGMSEFVAEIETLQARGAAAFLTTALEDELEAFVSFVRNSRAATSPKRQAIVRLSMFGVSTQGALHSDVTIRQAYLFSQINILQLAPARVHVLKDQMLAADPTSEDFETALIAGIGTLRLLIKEVTLGTQARR